MRMITHFRNIFLFFTIFLLVSCLQLPQSTKDISFTKIVPTNEINTKITLSNPPGLNSELEYGDIINLVVENQSGDTVDFPKDGGIKIFFYQSKSNKWQEVPNALNYYGGEPLLAPKGQKFKDQAMLGFQPNLTGFSVPTKIRVLTVGTVLKDNEPTNEQVSAYIDLTINKRDTCDYGICIFLHISEPISLNKTETLTVTIKAPVDTPFKVNLITNDVSVLKEPEVIGPNGFSNRTKSGLQWWVSVKGSLPLIITTPIYLSKDEILSLDVRAQSGDGSSAPEDAININISGENIKVSHLFPFPPDNVGP